MPTAHIVPAVHVPPAVVVTPGAMLPRRRRIRRHHARCIPCALSFTSSLATRLNQAAGPHTSFCEQSVRSDRSPSLSLFPFFAPFPPFLLIMSNIMCIHFYLVYFFLPFFLLCECLGLCVCLFD